jgi:hypothetical protein
MIGQTSVQMITKGKNDDQLKVQVMTKGKSDNREKEMITKDNNDHQG